MSTLTMYDAIPEEIPNILAANAHPEAVAGYVDLRFAWSQADWDRFPGARHLTIAASSSSRARCLDREPGDAPASAVPGWYRDHADHSHGLPWVYASASAVEEIIQVMTAAGISRSSYYIWSAHYTHRAHICGPGTCGFPQADGTQWDDTVDGRSCDISLLSANMFEAPPRPHPRATGVARAELSLNLATGHWHVSGTPGTDVHLGPDDTWASAELQINERTGHWRVKGLPFNAPPLRR